MREACCGFAALLWEEVLKASGEGLWPGGVAGGEVFRGLARQALAMELARAGGLTDFLYRAMAGNGQGAAGSTRGGCEKGGTVTH